MFLVGLRRFGWDWFSARRPFPRWRIDATEQSSAMITGDTAMTLWSHLNFFEKNFLSGRRPRHLMIAEHVLLHRRRWQRPKGEEKEREKRESWFSECDEKESATTGQRIDPLRAQLVWPGRKGLWKTGAIGYRQKSFGYLPNDWVVPLIPNVRVVGLPNKRTYWLECIHQWRAPVFNTAPTRWPIDKPLGLRS